MAILEMLNPRLMARKFYSKLPKRLSKSSLPSPSKTWTPEDALADAHSLPPTPPLVEVDEHESEDDGGHTDFESSPDFGQPSAAHYLSCQWNTSSNFLAAQPPVLPAPLDDVVGLDYCIAPEAIFPDWVAVKQTQDIAVWFMGCDDDCDDAYLEPISPSTSTSGTVYTYCDSEEEGEVQYASVPLHSTSTSERSPSPSTSSPAATLADEPWQDEKSSDTESSEIKTKTLRGTHKRKRDDSEDEDDEYSPAEDDDPDFVPNSFSAPPRRKRPKRSSSEPEPEPSTSVPVECYAESLSFPNPRCPVQGCNQVFEPDETPIAVGRHFLSHSSKVDSNGLRRCLLPHGKVMREEVVNRGRRNEESLVFFEGPQCYSEKCNAEFVDGTSTAKSLGRHILSEHMPLDVLIWCSRCHQRLARRDTINRHKGVCGRTAAKDYKKRVRFFQNNREVLLERN